MMFQHGENKQHENCKEQKREQQTPCASSPTSEDRWAVKNKKLPAGNSVSSAMVLLL